MDFRFGYDDAQLDYYPTKADLDKVSTDKPVLIIHTSGHLSVANSKALELAGITSESEDPKVALSAEWKTAKNPMGS